MSDPEISSRLGRCKMPEGYKLLQLDSGHFMWRHEESDEESCIHWNKWAIYHSAHANSKERSKPPVGSTVLVCGGIKAIVKSHHADGLVVGAGDGHLVTQWSKP